MVGESPAQPQDPVSQLNERASVVSAELSQVDAIAARIEQAVAEMDALKVAADRSVAAAARAGSADSQSLYRPENYQPGGRQIPID